MTSLEVRRVQLNDAQDTDALLRLLDTYAQDPMGGGQPLSAYARATLIAGLKARGDYLGWLAWSGEAADARAVGLLNAFEGFSTFSAKSLLNIHDVIVDRSARGQGLGRALLQAAEDEAARRGYCKLTLEVLSNNQVARAAYARFGFAAYELDATAGQALFLEKKLRLP